MNRCDLCERDKDEAMLLVPCGGKRSVCGPCAWAVAQSLASCGVLERSYENRNEPVPTALRQILMAVPGGGSVSARVTRPLAGTKA